MHFLARVRNFAMKSCTLVFSMRTGVRRRGSCESRAPRSSVRNTTSANNGYIAWAERLLLANDGNFFRGYVYPSPDDGFFRRQERGFPVARRAINDTAYFSKNRETGRQNPTMPRRTVDGSKKAVAREIRATARLIQNVRI